MFFHGGNDSRLAGELLDAAAHRTGVRLICPDRPGFGRSTIQPGRPFLDWPRDVEQLADHLGLDGFGLLGHSGGGPHALACASALPNRITRVATVSSVAPPQAANSGLHPMFRIVNALMNHPALYRRVARSQLRQMSQHPERWLDVWAKMQPATSRRSSTTPRRSSPNSPRRLLGMPSGSSRISIPARTRGPRCLPGADIEAPGGKADEEIREESRYGPGRCRPRH